MASHLETAPSVQSSRAEVWYLKNILFGPPGREKKEYKIITQNSNGPCSFIAICNILILRDNITILPLERRTVAYEFLSQLVAEYLLSSSPDVDISSALEIMPYTQKGMDLNPLFTSSTSFRPSAHTAGGGLDLFTKAKIELVHGWVAEPDTEEGRVAMKVKDYDTAVELIAEVDHLTGGRLLSDEETSLRVDNGPNVSGSGRVGGEPGNYSDEQKGKIEDAIVVRRFLESTSSQLTYHGLFHLVQSLRPYTLYALFRNSHLSVIYKTIHKLNHNNSDNSGSNADLANTNNANTNSGEEKVALYSLVTDQIFLHESSIVWERLEDVDGSSSIWVDSDFRYATPIGGDFAGQTAEEAMTAAEIAAGIVDPVDHELARQLQAEEGQFAQQEHEQYIQRQRERATYEQARRQAMEKDKEVKKKSPKDCVIV